MDWIDGFGHLNDGFDAELYARDPYFTRAEQAELRRRIADVEAGRNCKIRDCFYPLSSDPQLFTAIDN